MYKMKSKNQISFSADLDDSLVEIFRSRQSSNSVSQNASYENNQQKRNQSSVTKIEEENSVSNANIVQTDEFFGPNGNESTSKLNEICNLLKDNVIQHCPVCFKKNTSDQISSFIAHLKGCASKHKISTDQLIKAVQLVEKQTSERIALGLPKIASEKTAVKKNYPKKMGVDSNMQLAMALSASLRESEFLTRLKETETLIEAGLEQEVVLSCKQLEDFGFKTSKPCDIKLSKTNTRSKDRNSILFSRSQAERERIITEKVAIILVDIDGQNSDCTLPVSSCPFEPKSKVLRSIRDKNFTVWKKSFQSNEEASDEYYYLENLSSFISPCKVEVGAKLKHISQIPGRISSDESHFSQCLKELADFFRPTADKNSPKSTTKVTSSCPDFSKPKISPLSSDYKSLVNKKFVSDITIYVKNERSIYAHKLVFYARCNSILGDVIKETENGKTTEIIMWMEFCYESVIAFLEYIYADASDSLFKLDENQLSNLSELCARYHVSDLKECIDQLTLKDEPFASDAVTAEENVNNRLGLSASSFSVSQSNCVEETTDGTASPSLIDGEENLKFLQMALATQNEQPSPEMFVESDTPNVEENVDDDFSLSIRDSYPSSYDKETCSPFSTPTKINSVNSTTMKTCEAGSAGTSLSQRLTNCLVREEQAKSIVRWTCDTDVICLSDDDDDFVNIPQDVNQIKFNEGKAEKRKSPSPLQKSPSKKTNFEKESPEIKRQLKRKINGSRKQQIKRTSSSQYTLSDSLESSDSDESLYKINATNNVSTCKPSPERSFLSSFSQKSSKPASKDEEPQQTNKLISPDSSFELDDFRNLQPESRNFSSSSCPVIGDRCNLPTPKPEPLADSVNSRAEEEAPGTSPIWYGFDGGDDYFDVNFSPSPCKMTPVSKFSTPIKNLLTKSLVSPISSLNFRSNSNSFNLDEFSGIKNCGSSRTSDVPTFESFSIDESVLNKLDGKEMKLQAQSQVATPSNVRKLKARSKSDTFLTPSPRSNGCVTPIADYSGMKTVEIKRELDKYGIKPGLGKRKAKQLLRHIYDQLHPFDKADKETTPKRQPEEKQKIMRKSRSKNSARSNGSDEKLAAVSADSDESNDSFASGIEELEASFANDMQNLDSIEETKSQEVSIDTGFKNILREDEELHTQILLYEPIWLEQLKIKLKEKNIKCSSSSLMNYLDEKCITFRTQNQRRARKRRTKIKLAVETQPT